MAAAENGRTAFMKWVVESAHADIKYLYVRRHGVKYRERWIRRYTMDLAIENV